MNFIIETNSLTKTYKDKTVVKNLNLQVPQGSIYGFLGPNGAGKSTTMKLLLGLIKPTAGKMKIFQKEVTEKNRLSLLRHTGSLIESPAYYGHLSGRENLEISCKLKNIPESQIDVVLSIVRMEKQKDKKVKHYSLGMKQRLALANALLGHPRLLFLDEPTNGLDPSGIQEMRELISSLPEQGITVFLSSHLLSEIDQMATDVGIIDHGSLIFQDTLCHLHEQHHSKLRILTNADEKAFSLLKQADFPVTWNGHTLYLNTISEEHIAKTVRFLVTSNINLLRLEEIQISLEDIFLTLTGKQVSL